MCNRLDIFRRSVALKSFVLGMSQIGRDLAATLGWYYNSVQLSG
jgi:hypothetical protein